LGNLATRSASPALVITMRMYGIAEMSAMLKLSPAAVKSHAQVSCCS
jgi:hypothetical protein